MGVLQEIILMIDHTTVVSWDMQILEELLYTRSHTRPYFLIHRAHHVWFDEYNSRLYIEDKHNPGSLLLQQYPESLIHN